METTVRVGKVRSVMCRSGHGYSLYAEVAVDMGNTSVVPTITIDHVDDAEHQNGDAHHPDEPHASSSTDPEVPGAMPSGPTPAIPDWYKCGWRAVGGADSPLKTEGDEKDRLVLAAFLSEQYYGEWYHNAALIVAVSVFLSSPSENRAPIMMILHRLSYSRISLPASTSAGAGSSFSSRSVTPTTRPP